MRHFCTSYQGFCNTLLKGNNQLSNKIMYLSKGTKNEQVPPSYVLTECNLSQFHQRVFLLNIVTRTSVYFNVSSINIFNAPNIYQNQDGKIILFIKPIPNANSAIIKRRKQNFSTLWSLWSLESQKVWQWILLWNTHNCHYIIMIKTNTFSMLHLQTYIHLQLFSFLCLLRVPGFQLWHMQSLGEGSIVTAIYHWWRTYRYRRFLPRRKSRSHLI